MHAVYGWGAASFSRPESQQPHNIPLAYFKGPAGSIFLNVIDTETGNGNFVYIAMHIHACVHSLRACMCIIIAYMYACVDVYI